MAPIYRVRWRRPGWAVDREPNARLYATRHGAETWASKMRDAGAEAWVESAERTPWRPT